MTALQGIALVSLVWFFGYLISLVITTRMSVSPYRAIHTSLYWPMALIYGVFCVFAAVFEGGSVYICRLAKPKS